MAGVAQVVRAPDCGSGGRRFETGHSPHHNAISENMKIFFEFSGLSVKN